MSNNQIQPRLLEQIQQAPVAVPEYAHRGLEPLPLRYTFLSSINRIFFVPDYGQNRKPSDFNEYRTGNQHAGPGLRMRTRKMDIQTVKLDPVAPHESTEIDGINIPSFLPESG